ncbi:MAG: hypothetical protein WC058_01705 [Phycisphaeraceae bacterium]
MQTTDRPASRALFSDGNKIAISNAMMATTTKSSTSVKPMCDVRSAMCDVEEAEPR